MPFQGENHPREFYQLLPKIELHRHLEGSLRLTTMIETAREFQLDLPYDNPDQFNQLVQVVDGDPLDFQNFLSKFASLRLFYQSQKVIQRIAREVVEDAAADNIRYMELRFTPVALTRIKGFPMAEAVDWVVDAVQEASQTFGIDVRLIVSVNRHEPLILAERAFDLAVARKSEGVVGVDLAGNEAEYPGENFAALFREAREAGLHVSIHAGEWGGPERIRLALEALNAERIGHGVRVMEDLDLVSLAGERKIPFEVCPTSNYQSGVVTKITRHPLAAMIGAGLQVTLNTDDPGISRIELSDEYQLACEGLGVAPEALYGLIRNAAAAAFLPDGEKAALARKMDKELKQVHQG